MKPKKNWDFFCTIRAENNCKKTTPEMNERLRKKNTISLISSHFLFSQAANKTSHPMA